MAETIKYVDPDDTGSPDTYTSLSVWESQNQKTISAGNQEVVECFSSSGGDDITDCIIAGWGGIGATAYPIVRAKAGDEASTVWDASKYVFTKELQPDEDYIRIENIQFDQVTDANEYTLRIRGTSILIDGCHIKGSASATKPALYLNSGASCIVRNNIIYGVGTYSAITVGTLTNLIYNNTIHDIDDHGILNANKSSTIKNNTITSCTNGCLNGLSTATEDYNIVSDTTAVGSNSIESIAATDSGSPGAGYVIFADLTGGSEDFALQNDTDNTALAAGVGSGSDSNVPIYDIDGTTRDTSTPDIGAFEYVAAGGGDPLPMAMNYYRRMRV